MTYEFNPERRKRERDREPHPIWRGIGIMMIVLVPIISFAVSDLTIQWMKRDKGFRIPDPLAKWDWEIPLYGRVDDAWAVILFALVVMLIVFGIFTIINAIAYQATSDRNLRRFESAPQSFKRKRRLKKPTYEPPKKRR
jgi:uncharacterized membrane protein YidH (DUF202 family)